MSENPIQFWNWFQQFALRLPSDSFPETMQDELLAKLHAYDERLFYLACTEMNPRELIITVDGNTEAIPAVDALVNSAPTLQGWACFALKPAMGFEFTHGDGPISLAVSDLWF